MKRWHWMEYRESTKDISLVDPIAKMRIFQFFFVKSRQNIGNNRSPNSNDEKARALLFTLGLK